MHKTLVAIVCIGLSLPAWADQAMLSLAKKSGCLACHSIEKKLVGPAWQEVAIRYRNDSAAKPKLMEKIKKGGKGNWIDVTGGASMPAFAYLGEPNIGKLVDFVLSLTPQ